jgi:hypothetical protein
LGVDADGFLTYLNGVLVQMLAHLGLGPIQVHIIKVRKLFQALHNVAFDGLEPVVPTGLHQRGDQPKVQLFLLVLLLYMRDYLLQVNARLCIFLFF